MNEYWLFATIWFVAAATPGADTMLLLTTSISTGWRSAISISLGITTAKILLLTLTFFGLSALLIAAPQILVILKVFGCAFLLYKAFKLFRSSLIRAEKSRKGFWPNFALAFSIAVSNPQALLFYVAVVPQFTASTSVLWLNAIIAIGFALISGFYILLAAPINTWIGRGNNQLALNRVVAGIFVILAAVIALR